jgi:hypothetical protein
MPLIERLSPSGQRGVLRLPGARQRVIEVYVWMKPVGPRDIKHEADLTGFVENRNQSPQEVLNGLEAVLRVELRIRNETTMNPVSQNETDIAAASILACGYADQDIHTFLDEVEQSPEEIEELLESLRGSPPGALFLVGMHDPASGSVFPGFAASLGEVEESKLQGLTELACSYLIAKMELDPNFASPPKQRSNKRKKRPRRSKKRR